MVSQRVVCKTFIGRASELEHLVARRRAAADAKGGLILVAGEAGIGKSRLIAEFVRGIATRRAIAECREFAQSPFGPLDDVLAPLDDGHTWPRVFDSVEARLAETIAAFARISARRATLVIIEDLHWADPELIAVIRQLAVRAAGQRLAFIASYRDDEIRPQHRNFVAFGKLLREPAVSVVKLERMSAPLLGDLVRTALDGNVTLSTLAIDEVVRRSDGNPLFAEELSRHALDRRSMRHGDGDGVPITLHAIVRERLESCSGGERRLLFAAALCGRRFDLGVLDDILARDGATPDRDEMLRRLCDLQLLEPVDGDSRSFSFRHSLTRDALYAELLPSEAGPLHREIADALAARPDAGTRAVEIAYHYWQSGERERFARSFEAAGAAAFRVLAYGEAIRWYARAVDAYAASEREAARVRLELGKTYAMVEEKECALAAYADVERFATRTGDVELLVRSRKLTCGSLANDGHLEEAIALIDATLDALGEANHAAFRDDLILRVTNYLTMQQDAERVRRSLERIDLERLAPASLARADFHHARAYLAARAHDVETWNAEHASARAVFAELGGDHFLRYAFAKQAWQAWDFGDLALSCDLLEKASVASEKSATSVNDVPLGRALAHLHAGRFAAARAALESCVPSSMLLVRWLRADIGVALALALADDTSAREYLDLPLVTACAARDVYGFVRVSCRFGEALVRLDRTSEARALFEGAAARIASAFDLIPAFLALAQFAPDLALPLRPHLARDARDDRFAGGALALFDAEIASAAGRSTDAIRSAAVAHDAFASLGWPAFAARAADVAGRPNDALAIYRRIGHVAGTRLLARRERDDANGSATAALTARERELATLVAAGKTNREVALALSVSEKTVEKYLTTIYAKLAIGSRTQLARVMRLT